MNGRNGNDGVNGNDGNDGGNGRIWIIFFKENQKKKENCGEAVDFC